MTNPHIISAYESRFFPSTTDDRKEHAVAVVEGNGGRDRWWICNAPSREEAKRLAAIARKAFKEGGWTKVKSSIELEGINPCKALDVTVAEGLRHVVAPAQLLDEGEDPWTDP